MTTRLVEIDVREISLVDKAANPGSRVLIRKSFTPEETTMTDELRKAGKTPAYVTIEAHAQALMKIDREHGRPTTFQKAFNEVCTSRPDLLAADRAERLGPGF